MVLWVGAVLLFGSVPRGMLKHDSSLVAGICCGVFGVFGWGGSMLTSSPYDNNVDDAARCVGQDMTMRRSALDKEGGVCMGSASI